MADTDNRFLIVGLGNPGDQYAATRHNIGFMAIDALADAYRAPSFSKKFQGEFAELALDGRKLMLLKPQTFMNHSGRAVQAAMAFYKLPLANVVVLQDELDLPPGKLRIKQGGGANGQNGIRDIDNAVGPNYWRIRLGIGHPGDKARVHGHVLSAFGKDDRAITDTMLAALTRHFPLFFSHSPAALMSKVSEEMTPPREKPPKPVDKSSSTA